MPFENKTGTRVNDKTKDTSKAVLIVKAKGLRKIEAMPPTITSGKNAATVVNVPDASGAEISIAPSTLAFVLSFVDKACLYIFSVTTIASSTIMPIARTKAVIVITFKLSPYKFIKYKVAINVTGIVNATINVGLILPKKSHSINITNMDPRIRSFVISCLASFIISA